VTLPLFAAFGQTIFMLLLGSVATFLILLVLVQRGRGGGLAGALGGMGGSSAFGAKAGDVFTKITVVAATLWILLCVVAARRDTTGESLLDTKVSGPLSTAVEEGVEAGPALSAPAAESEDGSDEGEGAAEVPAESSGSTSEAEESSTEEKKS